jgi:citrate synthase
MAEERKLDASIFYRLQLVPKHVPPMDVLRTLVSALSYYDPENTRNDHDANINKAIRLTSQLSMLVATYDRIRKGRPVISPDRSLSHAANFLLMLNGAAPSKTAERAFDIALILHADHELNASTFAARVTAATLSDMHSAVTSAIGTLKGPLHGGANEEVIRMLLDAGDERTALAHVQDMLTNKKKIPGFGHRVYRTEDPRATHLRALSEELGRRTGHLDLYLTSKKIEETIQEQKRLNANVDFYSASTYYSLGIPIDVFTPIFAVSRMSGWTAHVLEQYRNNRLIRPRADYTGKPVGEKWIPINER